MPQNILRRAQEVLRSGQLDTIQMAKKRYAQLQEPVCQRYGITKTEMDVLLFLANNPGLDRAADIVNLRQITKSHVSLSVASLSDRGLLLRHCSPTDRRNAHLELTEQGCAIAQEARDAQVRFFDSLYSGIPDAELSVLEQATRKILDNIENLNKVQTDG